MSKQALRKVIDQENFMRGLRKETPIDIDGLYKINTENQALAASLFESIDGHLSPENLHCDGEISRAEATRKYRMYMGAVNQLENMGYTIPDECYECQG